MRHFKSEGIVLKRRNYGEADRIVTIFTRQYGKVVAIARGVRRVTSRKKGSLEPASRAYFYFAKGRGFDVLTQTDLIESYQLLRSDLTRMTQTAQILEIVDMLLADFQEAEGVYSLLAKSLHKLTGEGSKKSMILDHTRLILKELGYTHDKQFSEQGLKKYIHSLSGKKLKTKQFYSYQYLSAQERT